MNPFKEKKKIAELKNSNTGKILLPVLFLLIFSIPIFSQTPEPPDVGVDEKLGLNVPLDIKFYDEYGKTATLAELTKGKPTIISLVYYRCPGICSPLMSGLGAVLDEIDLETGKDFNTLTISFDPSEDYILAAEKKKNYFATFRKRAISEDAWRFLTADSINVKRITEAIGFKYIKQDNDFVHSGVLTVISPEGKITRYLYGIDFLPFDVKMALIEASQGKVGTTIAKIVKMCYSYDPEGRKYTLNVTRIAGASILFAISIFAIVLFITKKKKNKSKKEESGSSK
ncbi:MAG: SCO family protein [Ignavibacteria bacterium]|nr:SCO family protein [Ignavibacteria bacterium]